MLRLKRYPKRSPYWYVRGTVAGVHLFESSGTTERTQAEAYRHKRETEIYNEAALGKIRPGTFADAVKAYIGHGKSERFLTVLLDYFMEKPLPEIGQAEIDDAANELFPTAKASTLNRQVYGPMIAVLRHAVRAKLPGATLPQVQMRKALRPTVTPASDEHIAKLLPHCSEGLAALIRLMTYTGLRTGEALRVTQENINGGGFAIVGKTKTGKPRMVPLPEGWVLPRGGFGFSTTQGVGRALRTASRAAAIPYLDGHQIGRHAFAARWLRAGGSIKALKVAGGWETLRIVDETYGHMELSDVHDFMRKLSERK